PLVAKLRPSLAQSAERVAAAGEIGKPGSVFIGRLEADALDVAHHGKTERIGIETAKAAIIEGGLIDDGGMRVQEFQHGAVGQQTTLIEPIDDLIVDESGATLVHHLGLEQR